MFLFFNAQANDIEEVVVVARQVRIVLLNIVDTIDTTPDPEVVLPDEKMEQLALERKEAEEKQEEGR